MVVVVAGVSVYVVMFVRISCLAGFGCLITTGWQGLEVLPPMLEHTYSEVPSWGLNCSRGDRRNCEKQLSEEAWFDDRRLVPWSPKRLLPCYWCASTAYQWTVGRLNLFVVRAAEGAHFVWDQRGSWDSWRASLTERPYQTICVWGAVLLWLWYSTVAFVRFGWSWVGVLADVFASGIVCVLCASYLTDDKFGELSVSTTTALLGLNVLFTLWRATRLWVPIKRGIAHCIICYSGAYAMSRFASCRPIGAGLDPILGTFEDKMPHSALSDYWHLYSGNTGGLVAVLVVVKPGEHIPGQPDSVVNTSKKDIFMPVGMGFAIEGGIVLPAHIMLGRGSMALAVNAGYRVCFAQAKVELNEHTVVWEPGPNFWKGVVKRDREVIVTPRYVDTDAVSANDLAVITCPNAGSLFGGIKKPKDFEWKAAIGDDHSVLRYMYHPGLNCFRLNAYHGLALTIVMFLEAMWWSSAGSLPGMSGSLFLTASGKIMGMNLGDRLRTLPDGARAAGACGVMGKQICYLLTKWGMHPPGSSCYRWACESPIVRVVVPVPELLMAHGMQVGPRNASKKIGAGSASLLGLKRNARNKAMGQHNPNWKESQSGIVEDQQETHDRDHTDFVEPEEQRAALEAASRFQDDRLGTGVSAYADHFRDGESEGDQGAEAAEERAIRDSGVRAPKQGKWKSSLGPLRGPVWADADEDDDTWSPHSQTLPALKVEPEEDPFLIQMHLLIGAVRASHTLSSGAWKKTLGSAVVDVFTHMLSFREELIALKEEVAAGKQEAAKVAEVEAHAFTLALAAERAEHVAESGKAASVAGSEELDRAESVSSSTRSGDMYGSADQWAALAAAEAVAEAERAYQAGMQALCEATRAAIEVSRAAAGSLEAKVSIVLEELIPAIPHNVELPLLGPLLPEVKLPPFVVVTTSLPASVASPVKEVLPGPFVRVKIPSPADAGYLVVQLGAAPLIGSVNLLMDETSRDMAAESAARVAEVEAGFLESHSGALPSIAENEEFAAEQFQKSLSRTEARRKRAKAKVLAAKAASSIREPSARGRSSSPAPAAGDELLPGAPHSVNLNFEVPRTVESPRFGTEPIHDLIIPWGVVECPASSYSHFGGETFSPLARIPEGLRAERRPRGLQAPPGVCPVHYRNSTLRARGRLEARHLMDVTLEVTPAGEHLPSAFYLRSRMPGWSTEQVEHFRWLATFVVALRQERRQIFGGRGAPLPRTLLGGFYAHSTRSEAAQPTYCEFLQWYVCQWSGHAGCLELTVVPPHATNWFDASDPDAAFPHSLFCVPQGEVRARIAAYEALCSQASGATFVVQMPLLRDLEPVVAAAPVSLGQVAKTFSEATPLCAVCFEDVEVATGCFCDRHKVIEEALNGPMPELSSTEMDGLREKMAKANFVAIPRLLKLGSLTVLEEERTNEDFLVGGAHFLKNFADCKVSSGLGGKKKKDASRVQLQAKFEQIALEVTGKAPSDWAAPDLSEVGIKASLAANLAKRLPQTDTLLDQRLTAFVYETVVSPCVPKQDQETTLVVGCDEWTTAFAVARGRKAGEVFGEWVRPAVDRAAAECRGDKSSGWTGMVEGCGALKDAVQRNPQLFGWTKTVAVERLYAYMHWPEVTGCSASQLVLLGLRDPVVPDVKNEPHPPRKAYLCGTDGKPILGEDGKPQLLRNPRWRTIHKQSYPDEIVGRVLEKPHNRRQQALYAAGAAVWTGIGTGSDDRNVLLTKARVFAAAEVARTVVEPAKAPPGLKNVRLPRQADDWREELTTALGTLQPVNVFDDVSGMDWSQTGCGAAVDISCRTATLEACAPAEMDLGQVLLLELLSRGLLAYGCTLARSCYLVGKHLWAQQEQGVNDSGVLSTGWKNSHWRAYAAWVTGAFGTTSTGDDNVACYLFRFSQARGSALFNEEMRAQLLALTRRAAGLGLEIRDQGVSFPGEPFESCSKEYTWDSTPSYRFLNLDKAVARAVLSCSLSAETFAGLCHELRYSKVELAQWTGFMRRLVEEACIPGFEVLAPDSYTTLPEDPADQYM